MRIIAMTASCSPRCNTILVDLTNMLAFDDSESMMNAAGTIGTLVRMAGIFAHLLWLRTQQDPERFRRDFKTHLFNVASS